MHSHSLTAVLALLSTAPAAYAAAVPSHQPGAPTNNLQLKSHTLKAFHAATPDKRTARYHPLQRSTAGRTRSAAALKALRKSGGNNSAQLDNANGVEYLVPIEFGAQKFNAILDTGSSDTWLIASDFKCVDSSGKSQTQKQCNFATPFKGDFGANKIAGVNFNISYGDGEFVTGDFGYEDVTIAGITVKKQEVALGNSAYWNGNGLSSGLVGLAYPGITSAFEGTDPSQDQGRKQYDPLFTHMYKSKLSAPSFSLALQRGEEGGYIAFGGLPPVTFNQTFAKARIEALSLQGAGGQSGVGRASAPQFTFYAMTPDALVYQTGNSTGNSTSNLRRQEQTAQYIVDSGTTLNYLPSDVAQKLNGLFDPPAESAQGAYVVDCKAKVPTFGVTIGGTTFYADERDLVLTDQPDSQTGKCVTAFQDGGQGPYILGDAWMKSVVVVFDVGASEMRFAHHEY